MLKDDVSVPIQVRLSSQAYQRLTGESKSGDPAQTLGTWASFFLTRYAGGGIMLEPHHMEHLAKLNAGKAFVEATQIVKMVEEALNREEGSYTVRVRIDPALHGSIEEQARVMGWTVAEVMNEAVNQVLVNGWAFEFPAEDGLLALSSRDRKTFEDFLGKKAFTARDLADKIRSLGKAG